MIDNPQATVDDGKVVVFHYTLRNGDGDVLDTSDGQEPLATLQGAANIVPGLERELAGHTVGERLEVTVAPADGYGEPAGPGPQPVDRAAFPGDMEIHPGMPFFAEGPDGEHLTLWVTDVTDDAVYVDGNHPLAGETLHFEVEIVNVREATDEEKEHGHPHGIDGTAHHH